MNIYNTTKINGENKKILCKKWLKKKIPVECNENSENILSKKTERLKGDGKSGTNALHKKV